MARFKSHHHSPLEQNPFANIVVYVTVCGTVIGLFPLLMYHRSGCGMWIAKNDFMIFIRSSKIIIIILIQYGPFSHATVQVICYWLSLCRIHSMTRTGEQRTQSFFGGKNLCLYVRIFVVVILQLLGNGKKTAQDKIVKHGTNTTTYKWIFIT